MKILLQHLRTQLYLRNLGSWTPNPREAFDFRLSQSAIDFTHQHDLRGVQIVVKLNSREHEEVFPLPARAAARRPRA
jgi:hypothetical protein